MGFLEKVLPPAKPDRFARMVMKAMRQAGATGELQYEPDGFRISIRGDKGNTFLLSNAYRDYCSAPYAHRGRVIRYYAAAWGRHTPEVPATLDEARPHLLPQVRDRSCFEEMKYHFEMQASEWKEVPIQVLAKHLAVALVVDFPESMMTVNKETLEKWHVSFEEALAIARDNLWRISNEDFIQPCPGSYIAPWQDSHAASRLLLHDLVWQLSVKGEHVAMIPNRDLLMVTGTEDEQGLVSMAGLAEKGLDHTRQITGRVFVLRGSHWEPFLPAPGHPAHRPLRLLAVHSQSREYGAQKQYLDHVHQKTGLDVFVANVIASENSSTGEIATHCVWSKGVDALLPQTDIIALVVPGAEAHPHQVVTCTWETAQTVVGDLMVPVDIYPPRVRVKEFPSPSQLETIIEQSRPDAVQSVANDGK